MAGHLMLVNPRKKRRKLRRNPDAPAKKKRRVSRKTQAKRAVRRARKSVGQFAKRARRSTTKFFQKVRKGGRRSKRKGASRSLKSVVSNPAGFLRQTVVPAAIGAGGALALDMAYAYLPIPANVKNGALAPVVKIAAVGAIGATAAHFAPSKMLKPIHTAVTASIVIIAYGWLKARVQQSMPQVRLGEFLEDETICPIPGVTPLSYYQAGQFLPGDGMGEYVSEYISGPTMYDDATSYEDGEDVY